MKLALTLLLVGIAQSQTLLNTLRNLGATDSSFSDDASTGTYLTSNINQKLIQAIDDNVNEDIKPKEANFAKLAEQIKAEEANLAKLAEQIKAKEANLAKLAEQIKDIYAKAAAKKKEILKQLLMQEPKGTQGFIPTKNALETFKKLGGLNYQKLVENNIVEEPNQRVTIKLNFKRNFQNYNSIKYFEFAQVNSDGKLHGFARYISSNGQVHEAEFRNGELHGFQRYIKFKYSELSKHYIIYWYQNNKQKGYMTYQNGQNTPSYEFQSSGINARGKEAFGKLKQNGLAYYSTKY